MTTEVRPNRLDLPGGWYLVRCEEQDSPHCDEWFLSNPEHVWVAKFWDGPAAGQEDAETFAAAILGGVQRSGTARGAA